MQVGEVESVGLYKCGRLDNRVARTFASFLLSTSVTYCDH